MSKKLGLSHLRDLLSRSNGPEGLQGLPEKLEKVLKGVEDPELHPAFRADLFELLGGSVDLSLLLADRTYDARSAAALAARLHEVVARITLHLVNRPTNQAFGILFPRTGTLDEGIYSSEGEANSRLEALGRIGLREPGLVVPVTITSTRVAQPKAPPQADSERVDELASKLQEEMK